MNILICLFKCRDAILQSAEDLDKHGGHDAVTVILSLFRPEA